MRRTIHLLAATTLCAAVCGSASATQSVTLHATLTPEQLGHGTTIGLSFKIATPTHEVPPPLTSAEISYPVELAFALSELGLATCSTGTLEVFGVEGCPPNSLMGYGTALAEIPIGPSIASESAHVTIMRATNQAGHLALLIDVNAPSPVSDQITFPGLVLPASAPYGGRLDMSIPLVSGLPQGPDVAVVQFRSTLGPLHLHYHELVHGHVIEYEPKGCQRVGVLHMLGDIRGGQLAHKPAIGVDHYPVEVEVAHRAPHPVVHVQLSVVAPADHPVPTATSTLP